MSITGAIKAVKAAKVILKKDNRKIFGKIILIILSPLMLLVCLLSAVGEASTQHNQAVINTLFENKTVPESLPPEFRSYMEMMQNYFNLLDNHISELQPKIKEGVLDTIQIKSMFFSIYVNEKDLYMNDEQLRMFVLCFTEEIESDIGQNNQKEQATKDKQTLKALSDMQVITENIEENMNVKINEETIGNYKVIASYVNPGLNAKTDGDGVNLSVQLQTILANSAHKKCISGNMRSPFVDDWKSKVTSEFGYREEIVLPDGTITNSSHTGLDMGATKGTAIVAVNDGEVVYVRNHQKGLGLHLVVDHGCGKLSIYGHTSKIIVKEGDKVKSGQKIAEVGSTGFSTGNHLHLEIWENGSCQNPRNYLK